jgi:hypothetical protein
VKGLAMVVHVAKLKLNSVKLKGIKVKTG